MIHEKGDSADPSALDEKASHWGSKLTGRGALNKQRPLADSQTEWQSKRLENRSRSDRKGFEILTLRVRHDQDLYAGIVSISKAMLDGTGVTVRHSSRGAFLHMIEHVDNPPEHRRENS